MQYLGTRVLATLFCLCIFVSAEAALVGRLPLTPGGADYQAAYDDVLDITWTTDANLSGANTWENQVAWAAEFSLGMVSGWRLASQSVSAGLPIGSTSSVVGCSPANELQCRNNELGYMFYHNLGGVFSDNLTGTQTVGDITLTNIQLDSWSGTESALDFNLAWNFDFISGHQAAVGKDINLSAWAVRDGDVTPVPLPAAVWLFCLGLLGIIGLSFQQNNLGNSWHSP